MKRIGILGSTGSIGKYSLEVIQHLEEDFEIKALAAHSNIDLLEKQAKQFHPEIVAVWDESSAEILQKRIPEIPVLSGMDGVIAVATYDSIDLLLSAISGFDGVLPTLKAIQAKKHVALANKEVLVSAGKLILDQAKKNQVDLIPVDSEHTAIFQCLKGESKKNIRRIILTASGGPFWSYSRDQFSQINIKKALNHPNYQMGDKVTIDSSTLMNKGLEMIETHFLYQIPIDQIEVVVHPEQIIHSMVEFIDGSIMAQMGEPDMLVPIQVALTHPERKPGILKPFDFSKFQKLHFSTDTNKFRCLRLAYDSLREGGSMPCFMNAANEILVKQFLEQKISWLEIEQKLEKLMESHQVIFPKRYEDLAAVDTEARSLAERM